MPKGTENVTLKKATTKNALTINRTNESIVVHVTIWLTENGAAKIVLNAFACRLEDTSREKSEREESTKLAKSVLEIRNVTMSLLQPRNEGKSPFRRRKIVKKVNRITLIIVEIIFSTKESPQAMSLRNLSCKHRQRLTKKERTPLILATNHPADSDFNLPKGPKYRLKRSINRHTNSDSGSRNYIRYPGNRRNGPRAKRLDHLKMSVGSNGALSSETNMRCTFTPKTHHTLRGGSKAGYAAGREQHISLAGVSACYGPTDKFVRSGTQARCRPTQDTEIGRCSECLCKLQLSLPFQGQAYERNTS